MIYASKAIQGPCKGCTDRHSIKNDKGEIIAFCHRDCIKYKEFKKDINEFYKERTDVESDRSTIQQYKYASARKQKNRVPIK